MQKEKLKLKVKNCKVHGELTAEQCYINTYVTLKGLAKHYKCRECTANSIKSWTIKNKDLISQRHKDKAYSKKDAEEITDSYVKKLLSKQYGCSARDIPLKVIPLKRKHVELERAKEPIPESLLEKIYKLMEDM